MLINLSKLGPSFGKELPATGEGTATLDGLRARISSPGQIVTIVSPMTPKTFNVSNWVADATLPNPGFSATTSGRITWNGPEDRLVQILFAVGGMVTAVTSTVGVGIGINDTLLEGSRIRNFPSAPRGVLYAGRYVHLFESGDYVEMFGINFSSSDNLDASFLRLEVS